MRIKTLNCFCATDKMRCSYNHEHQGATQTPPPPPPPPFCPPLPPEEPPSINIQGSHLNCVIIGDNNYMHAEQINSTEKEELWVWAHRADTHTTHSKSCHLWKDRNLKKCFEVSVRPLTPDFLTQTFLSLTIIKMLTINQQLFLLYCIIWTQPWLLTQYITVAQVM